MPHSAARQGSIAFDGERPDAKVRCAGEVHRFLSPPASVADYWEEADIFMKKISYTKVIVYIRKCSSRWTSSSIAVSHDGDAYYVRIPGHVVAAGISGPVLAGVTAMLSDLAGFVLFPQGMTYFVGFALTGAARAALRPVLL